MTKPRRRVSTLMGRKAARYEQLPAERSLTDGGWGITDRAAADLAFLEYVRGDRWRRGRGEGILQRRRDFGTDIVFGEIGFNSFELIFLNN